MALTTGEGFGQRWVRRKQAVLTARTTSSTIRVGIAMALHCCCYAAVAAPIHRYHHQSSSSLNLHSPIAVFVALPPQLPLSHAVVRWDIGTRAYYSIGWQGPSSLMVFCYFIFILDVVDFISLPFLLKYFEVPFLRFGFAFIFSHLRKIRTCVCLRGRR